MKFSNFYYVVLLLNPIFKKENTRFPIQGSCVQNHWNGSKVDSAFQPSKVDKMSTRNFWERSGKK